MSTLHSPSGSSTRMIELVTRLVTPVRTARRDGGRRPLPSAASAPSDRERGDIRDVSTVSADTPVDHDQNDLDGWPKAVWCLVGPTATGKTSLAVELARIAPVEIISADSRMVYRWMDVGTAKPDEATRRFAAHHLVDVVDPDEAFPVVEWVARAKGAIRRVTARGKQPLLVGGTGLYLRALCDGLDFPPVAPDAPYRASLEARAARDGWQSLLADLQEVDPASAATIDPKNVRRVIRALEVWRATGRPFSSWQVRTPPPFDNRWAGLDLPVEVHDAQITERVAAQFEAGLLDEVASLRTRGFDPALAPLDGLAYREASQLLDGEVDRAEAIRRYAASTRQYARRQRSWFRPDQRIRWFDARDATAAGLLAHFTE